MTPDSLLALHAAGYRAVIERLGPGKLLDVGCGQGFESVGFVADDRSGRRRRLQRGGHGQRRPHGSAPRACGWRAWTPWRSAWPAAAFDWVCSSHLIEHFVDPASHVAEMARVLADDGAAFFLTPNEPADFENPFHLHLFGVEELGALLGRYFDEVWVGGVDATAAVKADFAARRAKAERLLRLDVFDLRHRMPRSWYVDAYTRLLPLAYRLVARGDTGGATGITADDWFVTDELDETTLVLFAVGRRPRRSPRAA